MEFIFVHINKTAGSSIETALGLTFRHRTALQIILDIGETRWQQAFTFSMVRNPWDRVVSHYAYRVQTNQTGLGERQLSFPAWVQETYGAQNPIYFDKPMMFMPQCRWLCDESGRLLVKFVGRFENLQEDFDTICARIGRLPTALPHRKSSAHGHYRDYYDAETRRIVADWFHDDIERFAYDF